MLYKYGFVTQNQLLDIALKANVNEFIFPKPSYHIIEIGKVRLGKSLTKKQMAALTLVNNAIPKPTAEVTNLHNYRKQRGNTNGTI